MELFLLIIWLLTALLIPLANWVIGYKVYKVQGLTLRFVIGFLGYLLITPVTFLFMLAATFGAGGAHARRSGDESSFGLIVVLAYLLSGWLLCSMVKGELINPLSIFSSERK